MKKSICILLVLALALCSGLALAEGCESGHSWSGWTTVTAATCTSGGLERRVCTECGAIDERSTSVGDHSWSGWTTVTEATCTTDGLTRRVCSVCGKTDDKSITANGHSWSGWTTTSEPTCTAAGNQRRICSACGTYEDQAIAANGHSWSGWTTTSEPTCTAAGNQRRICSECGTYEDQVIAANGHSWSEWSTVTAATCTTDGLTRRTCSVCNGTEEKTIAATGHDFKTVIVKPTTTSRGYYKHTCKVCGYAYRDNFSAKLPAPTAAVEEKFGEFDTIVFDANNNGMQYTTNWAGAQEENILTIVAAPSENGVYDLRELHVSFDMVEQLKEKEIVAIRFVVGDAELMIPMSIFDDEMLLVVRDDIDAAIAYVFVVDPTAQNDAGCLVNMEIVSETEGYDVTGIASGLTLSVAGVEQAVA